MTNTENLIPIKRNTKIVKAIIARNSSGWHLIIRSTDTCKYGDLNDFFAGSLEEFRTEHVNDFRIIDELMGNIIYLTRY
jgi:hypothetical protein